MSNDARRAEIARLNDRLRQTGAGGRVFITAGIAALNEEARTAILSAIRRFDAFTPDNDPYGEHDCASLKVMGRRIIWKIDYYIRSHRDLVPDPADETACARCLTIMLAEEY